MCGRFTLTTPGRLSDRFGVFTVLDPDFNRPNYNIAPGFNVPVIVRDRQNAIEPMKWGLIPSWAKDPKIGYKLINARDDSVAQKPAFRKAFKSQRCLVPANGFYEWKKSEGKKVPYYFRLKSQDMFAFAGLYDTWRDAEGQELKSFTIITTKPNSLVAPIHDRMPVIMEKGSEEEWVDKKTGEEELKSLLKPFNSEELEAYTVSDLVNSPGNNSKELVERK